MSEELIHIFAECTEAIEQGHLTVDQCLDKYPQYRTELIDLLQVGLWARALPAAYPTSEFRQGARARLLRQLPPRAAASNGAVISSHLLAATAVPQTLTQRLQSSWQMLAQRWPYSARPSLVVVLALLFLCFSDEPMAA